jgi:Tfp pilus assembly PilM family ATPase
MSHKLNAGIAVIGIDIGKNSFHVVGLDRRGAIVLRQKWSRGQVETRLANLAISRYDALATPMPLLKQLRDAEIGLAAHSAASFDNIISVSSRSRASPAAADRV